MNCADGGRGRYTSKNAQIMKKVSLWIWNIVYYFKSRFILLLTFNFGLSSYMPVPLRGELLIRIFSCRDGLWVRTCHRQSVSRTKNTCNAQNSRISKNAIVLRKCVCNHFKHREEQTSSTKSSSFTCQKKPFPSNALWWLLFISIIVLRVEMQRFCVHRLNDLDIHVTPFRKGAGSVWKCVPA